MMKQTNATLKDSERFAKKHDLEREMAREQSLREWDKLKFVSEKSSVDALRTKVQYYNGTMNLLLTSVGSKFSFCL